MSAEHTVRMGTLFAAGMHTCTEKGKEGSGRGGKKRKRLVLSRHVLTSRSALGTSSDASPTTLPELSSLAMVIGPRKHRRKGELEASDGE